ncbi:winged helix DNA-binding domain-containing protein [Streptomyces platensis]|nr:winged helix DNA-binding domain-containing protein [Streptomyces platensis]
MESFAHVPLVPGGVLGRLSALGGHPDRNRGRPGGGSGGVVGRRGRGAAQSLDGRAPQVGLAQRALAGRQAGNFPVLLIDGTVAGVWHQRRSGRRMIQLTVELLAPLTARQRRALDAQVQRVGEILQGTAELTIGTVSVGPHA